MVVRVKVPNQRWTRCEMIGSKLKEARDASAIDGGCPWEPLSDQKQLRGSLGAPETYQGPRIRGCTHVEALTLFGMEAPPFTFS